MNQRHPDIWSHHGHYPVDPYISPFKVMAKVKLDDHWGFQFILYAYLSFCVNQTIFGWYIANSTFDLENSVKFMAKLQSYGHIWGIEFNRYVCFFVSWQSDHFWPRYSEFHIRPWKFKVKVMAKVKSYGHIWGLEFNRYVCFLFHGNQTIFGRDIVNSIFDLENSRSRSWPNQILWSYLRWLRVQLICLLFVSWQSDHFWPRYSEFHIWP